MTCYNILMAKRVIDQFDLEAELDRDWETAYC